MPAPITGVVNPQDNGRRIHAVLFDLDGTLYTQAWLRLRMALELLALPLADPIRAPRRWRALAAYRRAQETLRVATPQGSIPAAQVRMAADHANLPIAEVDGLVEEWIMTRPLRHLRPLRAPGLGDLLAFLEARGVRAGVLSDYPAHAKLRALDLEGRFSPVLCSTDPDIGALKPDARGFLRACDIWQLAPSEVLVVGDRVDVDAAGAAAAGMPCVIVGTAPPNGAGRVQYSVFPSMERFRRALDESR